MSDRCQRGAAVATSHFDFDDIERPFAINGLPASAATDRPRQNACGLQLDGRATAIRGSTRRLEKITGKASANTAE